MARRYNDLFIGANYMNLEGIAIKHPSLIKMYATINLNKTSESPIDLIGLDLETDSETAELKLLGFWNGKEYAPYYNRKEYITVLFNWVKYAYRDLKAIAYWNKLDPFVIYKQFLYYMSDKERNISLSKYGKVSGEWNTEKLEWDIKPICEVKVGDNYFGIRNVIRSAIQFFFRKENDENIKTVWAYDIASLYGTGLENAALGKKDKETGLYPFKRLDYYTKIDESAHIIDWERFNNDEHYKNDIVLKSNELDARAVHDLGYIIQEEFKTTFKVYPKNLISQGSLARSAIVATLTDLHSGDKEKIKNDINSIPIINHLDKWANTYGKEFAKDLLCLMFETYYGGQIESYAYGYAPVAYTTDLTQAYPAHIQELYDLRGCEIEHGTGTPPHTEFSYCLIRGDVNIPLDVDYHPLTIKNPVHKETNIRGVGKYKASYTLETRDYLESLGATFHNEEWYNFITQGKLSPLAVVTKHLTDMRAKLRPSGKDFTTKTTSASVYGLTIEAVDTYKEMSKKHKIDISQSDKFYKDILKQYKNKMNLDFMLNDIKYHFGNDYKKVVNMWQSRDGGMTPDQIAFELERFGIFFDTDNPVEIFLEINKLYKMKPKKEYVEEVIEGIYRDGYRGGEFLNPLYASIITDRTRIQVSRAMNEVKHKGGKPVLSMTDSVVFTGTPDMIPKDMVRDVKTVGYFETVEKVTDLVCLGSGRYGYVTKDGYMQTKRRGLNVVEIHDPLGMPVDDFNWKNALKVMKDTDGEMIKVKIRALISVGMVTHNKKYTFKDLGRVVEEYHDVDVIVGKTKRIYNDDIKNANLLATQLIETKPIHLSYGMLGKNEIVDTTLPELRRLLMLKEYRTAKERKRAFNKVSVKNYHDKKKDTVKSYREHNYHQLKQYGYDSKERNKMQSWSMEKIRLKLLEDGKI